MGQNDAGRVVMGLAGLYNVFDFGSDPGRQTRISRTASSNIKNYQTVVMVFHSETMAAVTGFTFKK